MILWKVVLFFSRVKKKFSTFKELFKSSNCIKITQSTNLSARYITRSTRQTFAQIIPNFRQNVVFPSCHLPSDHPRTFSGRDVTLQDVDQTFCRVDGVTVTDVDARHPVQRLEARTSQPRRHRHSGPPKGGQPLQGRPRG